MLKTILKIDSSKLFHYTNEVADDIYSIQLYFHEFRDYEESIQKIKTKFTFKESGSVNLAGNMVYKLEIHELSKGEGDVVHGYHSFTHNSNYIRVYWNNKKKEIFFYA